MDSTAERYAKEPMRYPALHVVDLAAEGAAVTEPYRNMVISRVNDSCLRLAVFDEVYRWHYHPTSDELFIVVSGCLAIDLADNRELQQSGNLRERLTKTQTPASAIGRF